MASFPTLTDASFAAEALQADGAVLVEFGAEWCQPCKQMEPLLAQLASGEWKDKVRIVKVDVDEAVETATTYQVMSVPTFILFIGGRAVQRVSGKQPRDKMVDKFAPFLP